MKQHYIPRVYLKQFESSRKMLYTLTNQPHKNSPKIKESHRTQIGYQPDFYSITNPKNLQRLGLIDKDVIETKFNKRVEDRYEKVLAQLLSPTQVLTLDEAQEVLLMLLSFKQRNPMFRKTFQQPQLLMEAFNRRFEYVFAHQSTFEEILNKEGRMNFDEFVKYGRKYTHQVAHDPNTPQDIHTEGIVKFHQNQESAVKQIAHALLACEWFIFETTVRTPFITSDNPGFCIDSNERVHNLNFADSTGFMFPLTPRHCLLITAYFADSEEKIKQIHHRAANPDLVEIINRGSFSVCYKKLISNDENALRNVWTSMSRFWPYLTAFPEVVRNS